MFLYVISQKAAEDDVEKLIPEAISASATTSASHTTSAARTTSLFARQVSLLHTPLVQLGFSLFREMSL